MSSKSMLKNEKMGGQFTPAEGGQFTPESGFFGGGQFTPESRGQFDRNFHQITITENVIQVLPRGYMSGCIFHSGANVPATFGETILNNYLTILNSTSSTFKFGIYCLNCTGTIIGTDGNPNHIQIYDSQMIDVGVYVGNCDQVSVESNFITGPGFNVGTPGSYVPKGIYAATTTNSVYKCNELSDLVNGLTFDGICTGTTDKIKGNIINNYYLGLYYNNTAVTGLQNWTGNQWTGTNGFYGARIGNVQWVLSKYWVLPYAPYLPSIHPDYPLWFGSALHPNFSCSSPNPPQGSSEIQNNTIINSVSIFDHTDSIIALSSLSFPIYDQELNWVLHRYLLSKIESNPDAISSNSLMSNFYSLNINSSAWKYQRFFKDRKQALLYNSTSTNQIVEYKLNIYNLIDSLRIINSLLLTANSTSDSIILAQARLKLFYNHNSKKHLLDSILKIAENSKQLMLNNIKTLNQSLPETQVFERNEKIVNDIYLKTFAIGDNELTAAQKDDLYYIATQCPYSGGPAVYFARSLYLNFGGVFMNDDSLCNISQSHPQLESALIDNSSPTNFFYYPNPTKNQFTLNWDNKSESIGTIFVRNSVGVVVLKKQINLSKQFETFDISFLTSGVYFISIDNLAGNKNLGKIVIIQ